MACEPGSSCRCSDRYEDRTLGRLKTIAIGIGAACAVALAVFVLCLRPRPSSTHDVRNELLLLDGETLVKQALIPPGESVDTVFSEYDRIFVGFKTDANHTEFMEYAQKRYVYVRLHGGRDLFGSVHGMGMTISPEILRDVFGIAPPPSQLHLDFTNYSDRTVAVLIYRK